jgi:hypothetical protein
MKKLYTLCIAVFALYQTGTACSWILTLRVACGYAQQEQLPGSLWLPPVLEDIGQTERTRMHLDGGFHGPSGSIVIRSAQEMFKSSGSGVGLL